MGATYSEPVTFDDWLAHFRANPTRQLELENSIEWDAPAKVTGPTRRAFIRSFQRFELGEDGDGEHLLRKATRAGDSAYLASLSLLVQEEQKHSELFRRGLARLHAPRLEAHWSDAVFTGLRRMLGLRTELALFLVAETVAMGYFTALADRAPDPVLRGIGQRIATDEQDHIRFHIDRLRHGFRCTFRIGRLIIGLSWGVIAAGAALVIVVDHGPALRACGLSRTRYWCEAMREFHRVARSVLVTPEAEPLGPLMKDTERLRRGAVQRT